MQWDPPASSNGIITHYIITVEGNSTNVSSYDTLHTFRNLFSNITYQFKIKAATSAGDGEEQICNASTLPEKGNKLFELILWINLNYDYETSRPEISASVQATKPFCCLNFLLIVDKEKQASSFSCFRIYLVMRTNCHLKKHGETTFFYVEFECLCYSFLVTYYFFLL